VAQARRELEGDSTSTQTRLDPHPPLLGGEVGDERFNEGRETFEGYGVSFVLGHTP
jgi:hypothetical protein